MTVSDYTRQSGAAALGARLRRLSERIDRDAARLYDEADVAFEQRWFGVVNLLKLHGAQTVGVLAVALGVSHASVSQVRQALGKAGLIDWETDGDDARRRKLRLSDKGAAMASELAALCTALSTAAVDLNAEAGDPLAALDRLEQALDRASLYNRVRRAIPSPSMGADTETC